MNSLTTKARVGDNGRLQLDAPPEWAGREVEIVMNLKTDIYTMSQDKDAIQRRHDAIEAMRKLASMGGIKSIPDPVAWQKEIREDRPLPGREE